MNSDERMNDLLPKGAGLERALLARIREVLSEVGWLHEVNAAGARHAADDDADAVLRVTSRPGTQVQLRVHVRAELRPGEFPGWLAGRSNPTRGLVAVQLLAMPVVSPRMAELCRSAGWSWIDLAGNCRIDVPGVMHVDRNGRPPRYRPPRPTANLSTPEAARVIRALLSTDGLGRFANQRDLRARTVWRPLKMVPRDPEVSLGLVNKVVRHLRDEGFLVPDPEGGMRVQHPDRLLAAWRDAYGLDRHERHGLFTLSKGPELRKALNEIRAERTGDLLAYAAFSAAERQAPQVRQAKTWLFADAELLAPLIRRTEAKETDSGENLVVLVPEDSGVFAFRTDGDGELPCTNPVQTYVDVWHCGGRGEEAAQAVLEQKIKPVWDLWEKAGKAGTA